jgi:hypothetical protein
MTEIDGCLSLDRLLSDDPKHLYSWISTVINGEQAERPGINWLGLAEGAAANTHIEGNLDWAHVAVYLYEHLANEAAPASKESFILSAMRLRAFLISKYGAVPNDPILDLERITRWFFDSLQISQGEAADLADVTWKALSTEDVRRWNETHSLIVENQGRVRQLDSHVVVELRRMKNRLSVIEGLVESGQLKPNTDLAFWLSLREKLP